MTRKVVATPCTCFGKPRFEGTRLSMEWFIGVTTGYTDDDIVADWSPLTHKDFAAARRWICRQIAKANLPKKDVAAYHHA